MGSRFRLAGSNDLHQPPGFRNFLSPLKIRRCVPPALYLQVKRIANGTVKFVCIGALEHHAKIVAVRPVLLCAELHLYALMESRVRKWVGK